MKNRELLKTGKKPAPGDLVLLQGFINTTDLEEGTDDLADPAQLKAWLIRHGLLAHAVPVSSTDHRAVVAFRESLRHLLAANHGVSIDPHLIKQLNRLIADCRIAVKFGPDGRALLEPGGTGVNAAMSRLLALVIQAAAEGTWVRLKVCEASTCRWAFYDASKNNSGRWCSMAVCGSRLKARQYRKRHASRS